MIERRLTRTYPSAGAWASPSLGLVVAAALLPSIGALVPLGIAPLLLVSAALSVALGAYRRFDRLWRFRALLLILGSLCLWATVSALWSILPLHSLLEGLRLCAIVGAGLIVLASAVDIEAAERERVSRALVWGFAIALTLLAVAALARALLPLPPQGTAMAHWLRGYARFDRGATILAIALWPTLLVIGGAAARWRGAGLFVATALVVLGLPSRAAMLSMLVGLVSLLLSLRMPRPMAATIGAAVVAFGLAFSLGTLDSATISRIHERLPWLQNSALHRLAIWHFGMDRVAERPLLGWGLDASRALPGGEAVIDDPALPKVLIGYGQWMPLHPHNAVLQWRLELGVPGLILCILAILWILWRIAGTETVPIRRRAIGLALAASTLVVALISYGFWQEWWQSSFWLLAALAIAVAPYDARAAAGDAATG